MMSLEQLREKGQNLSTNLQYEFFLKEFVQNQETFLIEGIVDSVNSNSIYLKTHQSTYISSSGIVRKGYYIYHLGNREIHFIKLNFNRTDIEKVLKLSKGSKIVATSNLIHFSPDYNISLSFEIITLH